MLQLLICGKRVGYDEYLKEYCISRHLKITDMSEILSELEEAAKPYETMEEWFSHIEEYTEALKKRETEGIRRRKASV